MKFLSTSIATLLRGYTANGAYQLRMNEFIGSIETGKHADLVVLEQNPFEAARSEIHEIRPTAVMRGGELTFGDS